MGLEITTAIPLEKPLYLYLHYALYDEGVDVIQAKICSEECNSEKYITET